jgi:hypothetical protein
VERLGHLLAVTGLALAVTAHGGGALLAALGFGVLAASGALGRVRSAVLFAAVLGVGLDLLLIFDPGLGPSDGVVLRMLRLARVATIAVPLMATFADPLRGIEGRAGRWAGTAFAIGAVGLPALLAASALVSMHFKHLLFIPADAAVIGAVLAALASKKAGRPLEGVAWSLIACSMVIGLGMGAYAFDGPFPAPAWLGGYGDQARMILRGAHAGAITAGIAGVLLLRAWSPLPGPAAGVLAAADPAPLERLARLSLSRSFVPEKDLDWTQTTTDAELESLYPAWSLFAGSGKDQHLDAAARTTYVKYQQINLMTFTALFERYALAPIAELYDLDPSPAFKEYVGHFLKEEIYHYTLFNRAMASIRATMPDRPPLPDRGLDLAFRLLFPLMRLIPGIRFRTVVTVILFRFAERVTIFAHQTASHLIPREESLLAQVWRYHALDEGRHVAFDSMVIERCRLPRPLATVAAALAGSLAVMISLLLNANEIWIARQVGIEVSLLDLPQLMRTTTAPFKRRVFGLIQSELRGEPAAAPEAAA